MKFVRLAMLLPFLLSLNNCGGDEPGEVIDVDVEEYVGLLKKNYYQERLLPAFTYKNIPALLKYRNETQIITKFPHNGLSSFYGPECKLGIYVLWTIESIRAVAIESEFVFERFPSLNPILAYRNVDEWSVMDDELSHTVVAEAYYSWWENNKHRNFEAFKNIDPLAGTDYKWH